MWSSKGVQDDGDDDDDGIGKVVELECMGLE